VSHFNCWEIDRETFHRQTGVQLDDQFGSGTVDVIRPKRLCAPADKNGEDPTAPSDPKHMTAYQIMQRVPHFQGLRRRQVINQFGTFMVDLVRPDRLLVPAAKGLTAPPAPLVNPVIDRYKCYRIKHSFGTPAFGTTPGVTVVDQFTSVSVTVLQPLKLCMPANLAGQGILDPNVPLMCYQIKSPSGPTIFPGPRPIFLADDFGSIAVALSHADEICVPSRLVAP